MIKKSYKQGIAWIEIHRFKLLILATFLVLVLPAFSGSGLLSSILFVTSMSFLFIQSMIVARSKKEKYMYVWYGTVVLMIMIFSLEPIGWKSIELDILRLLMLAVFFIFITYKLVQFMRKSTSVSVDLILTAINIYLLIGIISASLAFLCYCIYPAAYQLPSGMIVPSFVTFLYYSYITMSTVGYGDIIPRVPETQTLAYLIAITGQLYVAVVIATLVGKFLMHNPNPGEKNTP
jgi:hypothetical protein